jgi:hypothetical protein
MVATCALLSMNMVAQGRADVARDNTLIGPISLYALFRAHTGEGKSTVEGHIMKPIKAWLEKKRISTKPLIKERDAEITAWKKKCSGIGKAIEAAAQKGEDTAGLEQDLIELSRQEPAEITEPQLFHGDVNVASFGDAVTNGFFPIGAMWDDEGGTVIGGNGMNSDNRIGFLSMFDKLWDCGTYRNGRKSVKAIDIVNRRICVSLMLQPKIFDELRNDGVVQSLGFFSRCLFCS